MSKIPLSVYIARNAPDNAIQILQAWGMPVESRNPKVLAKNLNTLFTTQGEGVLKDMGNLHPDKDLILAVEAEKSGREQSSGCDGINCNCKSNEQKSGACGCSSGFGGGAWNSNEGSYYGSNRNTNLDEFQVYGFNGINTPDGKKIDNSTLFFGAVAVFLAYQLYKNS